MKKPRLVAFYCLNEILIDKGYSNIVLNRKLKDINIKEEDKGLITEIVYGTLRYKYSIDIILDNLLKTGVKKTNKDALNILRMTIYQLRYMDKIPEYAAINEAVDIAKEKLSSKIGKMINGVLREYLRSGFEWVSKDNLSDLAFKYSYEKWMVKYIVGQYGESTAERILDGLNNRPVVNVRVNTYRSELELVFNELIKRSYNVTIPEYIKNAIEIHKGSSIENNELYQQGLISVQDQSAMLAVQIMELDRDKVVLDLCSAPGGKSCYIGEMLNNTGEVKAFDIYEKKIKLIDEHCERLGLNNVTAEIGDATKLKTELINSADIVLADVPCSGLGIIRKKPEIKWTKNKTELKEIVEIQRKILRNAAEYVKINGVLVYSTCTLNRNENDENIRWFLKENPNYEIAKLDLHKSDNMVGSKEGAITILPNESMDGFYICKLIRKR